MRGSSTSSDVCELWNGVGIVRVVGSPSVLELIYINPNRVERHDRMEMAVNTLNTAKLNDLVVLKPSHNISLKSVLKSWVQDQKGASKGLADTDIEKPRESPSASPPNIVLNISGGTVRTWETIFAAVIGVVVQVGVLVYDGVITYLPDHVMQTDISMNSFVLTLVGTLGVSFGTYLCASVIESSTEEEIWEATFPHQQPVHIIWLQRGEVVADQSFGSYAIYNTQNHQEIRTSRKLENTRNLEALTLFGSALCMCSM